MGEVKYGNGMRCNNKKGGMNQSSFGKMGKKKRLKKQKVGKPNQIIIITSD